MLLESIVGLTPDVGLNLGKKIPAFAPDCTLRGFHARTLLL